MVVLRTQLRGLAARPSRLLLTAVSVAVATAFAFGTALAAGILERTVVDQLSGTPAATGLVLEATGGAPLTDREVTRAERVPGVAEVVGRIETGLEVGGVPGDAAGGIWNLVGDPGSGALSLLGGTRGTYPRTSAEVAVTTQTAERTGLRIGSPLTLLGPGKPPRVATVTAVVTFADDNGYQLFGRGADVAGLGDSSGYRRLEVRAEPGTDQTALTSALHTALGDGVWIRTAAEARQQEAEQASASIKPLFAVVGAFVLVAVVAAVLVTASTFRIVFAQRMGQLALLRTVGARRRSLVGALVTEGAMTGAVAGTAGVTAGLALAYAATAVLRGLGHDVASPGFPVGTAVACVAGAVLVTVAAVLAPAVAAARVRPLEALRTSAVADTAPRAGWVRIGLGVLLVAGAALASVPVLTADPSAEPQMLLLAVIASGLALFGALLALGPVVTPPLARLVGWPLTRAGGVPGRLAVRGALRAPRRVAATTVVVTLGVTLVTGVLVGSASLRGYADAQVASEFPADLLVKTVDNSPVPAALIGTLQRDDRLARVVPVRETEAHLRVGGEDVQLRVKGLAVREVPALSRAAVDAGDLDSVAPGRIALARSIASDLGASVGDTVTVTVGKQHFSATVTAVYDGSDALGPALLDAADLRRLAPALLPTSLFVDVRDRSADGIDAARAAAVRAAGQGSPVAVLTPATLRAEIDQVLTIVSGVALGLLGLTLAIAVVGVATTMALSVVERTREFGLLRALGLGRRGLRASIALESGLFGAVGAVLGLVLGVLYGWLGLTSLQLSAPLVVPLGSLAGTAALLAGLAALAGLLPSRRAARTAPVAALAAD